MKINSKSIFAIMIISSLNFVVCSMNNPNDSKNTQNAQNTEIVDNAQTGTNQDVNEQVGSVSKSNINTEIHKGLWLSKSKGTYNSYYLFYDDDEGGTIRHLDLGIGISFRYDKNGNDIVFHMGEVTDNTSAKLNFINKNEFEIIWTDNSRERETLTYIEDMKLEDFNFYSNEDLSNAIISYYSSKNADSNKTVNSKINSLSDGKSVNIELYDNKNNKLDSYNINRFTAEGIDNTNSETFNLKAFLSD